MPTLDAILAAHQAPNTAVNVPNLLAVRNLDSVRNVASCRVHLGWLDTDGKPYVLTGWATTVPGDGNLEGYDPSVQAPGWWPNCWKSGLMHAGTPSQQDAFVNTGNTPYWWAGHLDTINRSVAPHASRWCCFHEMWDVDTLHPGIQIGNGSYGCMGIFPVGNGFAPFAAFRSTLRTLMVRTNVDQFGVCLIERHAGDPLLGNPN